MATTIDLTHCSFNREKGHLSCSTEPFGGCFPKEVSIKSHVTGNVVRFVQDVIRAQAHEFWDGEMCEYVPIDPTNNCNRLVLHHAF